MLLHASLALLFLTLDTLPREVSALPYYALDVPTMTTSPPPLGLKASSLPAESSTFSLASNTTTPLPPPLTPNNTTKALQEGDEMDTDTLDLAEHSVHPEVSRDETTLPGHPPTPKQGGDGVPLPPQYHRRYMIPSGYFGLGNKKGLRVYVDEPTLLFTSPSLAVGRAMYSSRPVQSSPHSFYLKPTEDNAQPFPTYYLAHNTADGDALCLAARWHGLRFLGCNPDVSLRVRGIEKDVVTGATRIIMLNHTGNLLSARCLRVRTAVGLRIVLEHCEEGDDRQLLFLTEPNTGEIIR